MKKIIGRYNFQIAFFSLFTFHFSSFAFAQLREIPYNSDSTFYRADLAIKNSDRCYYLFLEADSLNSLPSNFKLLKHLKGIAFKHCPMLNLDEVMKELAQLPTLEYLEISVSSIKSLPDNIGTLQQLQSLNLKSNLFTELPSTIKQCSK